MALFDALPEDEQEWWEARATQAHEEAKAKHDDALSGEPSSDPAEQQK